MHRPCGGGATRRRIGSLLPATADADDFTGCLTLARAGGGLVQAYHFLVSADVEAGALVEVLPHLAGRSRPFHLVAPPGGSSKAARALAAPNADDAAEPRPS